MKFALIVLALLSLSCSATYVVSHRNLYEAEIVVTYDIDGRKINGRDCDTMDVVYWDYIELVDNMLLKKDSQMISDHVKSYKFISKKKVDL
jgi:hypothetical protein